MPRLHGAVDLGMENAMLKLWVTVAIGAAVVGGCASPDMVVGGGAAAPTTSAAPATTAAPIPIAEQRYLNQVNVIPNSTSDQSLLEAGRWVCTQVGQDGMSREWLILGIGEGGYGSDLAAPIVDAAKLNLCPEKLWVSPEALAQAQDVGPKDVIKVDGQWHVGTKPTDHVQPGTYRTDGSDDCYYAKLDPANPEKILSNHFGAGSREVKLNEGDFFETSDCGTWNKQP